MLPSMCKPNKCDLSSHVYGCICVHAGVLPLLVDLRDYCVAEHTLVIRVKYAVNIYVTRTVVFFGGCRGKYGTTLTTYCNL